MEAQAYQTPEYQTGYEHATANAVVKSVESPTGFWMAEWNAATDDATPLLDPDGDYIPAEIKDIIAQNITAEDCDAWHGENSEQQLTANMQNLMSFAASVGFEIEAVWGGASGSSEPLSIQLARLNWWKS